MVKDLGVDSSSNDTVWEDNFLGESNFKGKITGLTGEKTSKIEIETTSGDVNLSTE